MVVRGGGCNGVINYPMVVVAGGCNGVFNCPQVPSKLRGKVLNLNRYFRAVAVDVKQPQQQQQQQHQISDSHKINC